MKEQAFWVKFYNGILRQRTEKPNNIKREGVI